MRCSTSVDRFLVAVVGGVLLAGCAGAQSEQVRAAEASVEPTGEFPSAEEQGACPEPVPGHIFDPPPTGRLEAVLMGGGGWYPAVGGPVGELQGTLSEGEQRRVDNFSGYEPWVFVEETPWYDPSVGVARGAEPVDGALMVQGFVDRVDAELRGGGEVYVQGSGRSRWAPFEGAMRANVALSIRSEDEVVVVGYCMDRATRSFAEFAERHRELGSPGELARQLVSDSEMVDVWDQFRLERIEERKAREEASRPVPWEERPATERGIPDADPGELSRMLGDRELRYSQMAFVGVGEVVDRSQIVCPWTSVGASYCFTAGFRSPHVTSVFWVPGEDLEIVVKDYGGYHLDRTVVGVVPAGVLEGVESGSVAVIELPMDRSESSWEPLAVEVEDREVVRSRARAGLDTSSGSDSTD